ncbi:hypothetical protein F5B18DRAFT_635638 [Nemania serpens]|nr:hypothetical protein F5B18DRAFT_635638 [Nemania serpens]
MSAPDPSYERHKYEEIVYQAFQIWFFIIRHLTLVLKYLVLLTLSISGINTIRDWALSHWPKDPSLQACYEENKKLTTIWAIEDKSGVIIITLEIGLHLETPNGIYDIGLSYWCLSGDFDTTSHHHRIIDKQDGLDEGFPDGSDEFIGGITGHIRKCQIENSWIKHFAPQVRSIIKFVSLGTA